MDLELYDCTLREGEQSAGASFSLEDRVDLFRRLDDFGIEIIEGGWPVAGEEILDSFKLFRDVRKKAKISAFGSTSIAKNPREDANLRCLLETKADYACIFGKTWKDQVAKQLRISSEENLDKIRQSVLFLISNRMPVMYDAEHYFDGFKQDKAYSIETLVSAAKAGAERLILCDTNGGCIPIEVEKIVRETKQALVSRGVNTDLGVHLHDDCGFALENTVVSLPYVRQVQGTINGIGERVGNLNFSEFIPVYIKKLGGKLSVNLKDMKELNEESFRLSGMNIPDLRAFVGDTAFAHKGGVHIDATHKGASYEHASPEDFGNRRIILLNTLGGKAGVIKVAEYFGYKLDKKNKDVEGKVEALFVQLRDMENKGYRIGGVEAEQYLLIERYFGNLENYFDVEDWDARTGRRNEREISSFDGTFNINGERILDGVVVEGGPVDAAYKTFRKTLESHYPRIKDLILKDYHVGIARSRKEESTVRVKVTFENGRDFQTVGVNSNIIEASLEAISKGFRYFLNTTR